MVSWPQCSPERYLTWGGMQTLESCHSEGGGAGDSLNGWVSPYQMSSDGWVLAQVGLKEGAVMLVDNTRYTAIAETLCHHESLRAFELPCLIIAPKLRLNRPCGSLWSMGFIFSRAGSLDPGRLRDEFQRLMFWVTGQRPFKGWLYSSSWGSCEDPVSWCF